MKKIISVVIVACGLLLAGNAANAQTKIGYMSVDQMIGLMPETARIDSQLQRYQADSVNATFAVLVQDYNYKDSMLNKNPDTAKIPASVKSQYRRDLESNAYQIQNWNAIANQLIQNKQDQLLAPVYNKVVTALRAVAKEKGYVYVLSKDVFLVAPDADDLLPLVAAKLGVKLPAKTPGRPN